MKHPDLTRGQFSIDRILRREHIPFESDSPVSTIMEDGREYLAACLEGNSILKLRPRLSNFSQYDLLSLTALNRSDEPILVGLKLVHGRDKASFGSPNISFTGGRETLPPGRISELRFPVESFGWYGKSRSWESIREIGIILSREKNNPGQNRIEILFEGLYGESREVPRGPRLSPEGLAEVLTRDVSGVTSFFSGECRGTYPCFEARRGPLYPPFCADDLGLSIPPPHTYPAETVKEILDGYVMGQHVGRPISWDCNPLGCQEWSHFLHRHHFLRTVVRDAAGTGNEECVKALDEIVLDWVKCNPVPLGSNGGAGPSWETLSTAWRLREWLWIVGIAWCKDSFRLETRQVMLASLWEHARSLMDHQGHPNNWIIVESAALTLAGLCFQEFKEAQAWFETGLERLRDQSRQQFFPDGVHFEISPLYHSICLAAMLEVKQAAEARGKSLPEQFGRRLEKSLDYLAALCRPDFSWPSLNDSGGAVGDYRLLMKKCGQVFNRPDLTWLGSSGGSGNAPEAISRIFPNAGVAIMRSNHGHFANHLVFRSGPAGAAHVHGDVLSLDVTALGQLRLVDPGITTYAPDILTEHYRSAKAHNTLLIDGKEPMRAAVENADKSNLLESYTKWNYTDTIEIATGICRGSDQDEGGKSLACRTIIFVKGEYWIIRDSLVGAGTHSLTACWQFFPGRLDISRDKLSVTFFEAQGPRFTLISLNGDKDFVFEEFTGSMDPCSGWVSVKGADYPAASLAYTIKGFLPITLLWLLIPFWGRSDAHVEGRRCEGNNREIALEILFPERHKDFVSFIQPDSCDTVYRQETLHSYVKFTRTRLRPPAPFNRKNEAKFMSGAEVPRDSD